MEVVNPGTRIGHVHLKVADIERALGFYTNILGFEVTQWYGDDAVFLSAGGYHHHLGLNTWMSRNAGPPRLIPQGSSTPRNPLPRAAGPRSCPQVASGIQVPHRRRLDHGASEALYLRDPDSNGVSYIATAHKTRRRTAEGELAMVTRPLDVEGLLSELE